MGRGDEGVGMGREAREVAVAGEEVRSGEWWEAAMAWVWWEEVMAGEWWEAVMAGAWWVEVTARWLLLARSSSSSLTCDEMRGWGGGWGEMKHGAWRLRMGWDGIGLNGMGWDEIV
jgi:hypothetical protein